MAAKILIAASLLYFASSDTLMLLASFEESTCVRTASAGGAKVVNLLLNTTSLDKLDALHVRSVLLHPTLKHPLDTPWYTLVHP